MSIIEESTKAKNAIEKMVGAQIETATNNCVRLFKSVVVTAPNATTKTIGVKKIGDNTVLNIPYSTAVESSTVGAVVWLMQCYGTRNLIAWLPYNMNIGEKEIVSIKELTVQTNGSVLATYTDGSTKVVIPIPTVTIKELTQQTDKSVVATYTNNTTKTVISAPATPPVSIKELTTNQDGSVTATYTDSSTKKVIPAPEKPHIYKRRYELHWSGEYCNIYFDTLTNEPWDLSIIAKKISDLGCISPYKAYPATYMPWRTPVEIIMIGVVSDGNTVSAFVAYTDSSLTGKADITSMEETIIEL